MTFVKVCGITRESDATEAVRCGATVLGFVFWPESARYVDPDLASDIIGRLPRSVNTVGVFVNQSIEDVRHIAERAGISTIQLHGDEPASYADAFATPILKAITLDEVDRSLSDWPDDTLVLLDAHDPIRRGGTGQVIDWEGAAKVAARRRVVLAGGLTADNVRDAISAVHPFGVDVSSGVERSPGIKDHDRINAFFEALHATMAEREGLRSSARIENASRS